MSRVLVARMDNAGDVLLAGPAVRAVAAATGPVTLLCGARGRAAAELLPGVGEIVEWTAPWIDPEPGRLAATDALALVALLRRRFAEAIVLTSYHQSPLPLALLLRMADVPSIAAVCEDYPGSLLDVRQRPDDGLHEVERSLRLVGEAGYALPHGDDGRLRVLRRGRLPEALEPPYVVLHPGASVPARTWRPERWGELAAGLAARGRRIVVTGARSERDLTAAVAAAAAAGAADLGGRTSLADLAEVLAAADAVVTGNTGPAHLAAAVGAPVVSLYAPTVPAHRWRPWRVPHILLGDQEIACAGCRARTCPVAGHPCLESVTTGEALDAVDALAGTRLEVAAG
jgi:ADP-heptose:LPS heptosyltransferase